MCSFEPLAKEQDRRGNCPGRFAYVVPVVAIAGSLAAKKRVPPSAGTFPTDRPLFMGLLVRALTHRPGLGAGAFLWLRMGCGFSSLPGYFDSYNYASMRTSLGARWFVVEDHALLPKKPVLVQLYKVTVQLAGAAPDRECCASAAGNCLTSEKRGRIRVTNTDRWFFVQLYLSSAAAALARTRAESTARTKAFKPALPLRPN